MKRKFLLLACLVFWATRMAAFSEFEYEGLRYGVLDEEAKTCGVYGFANGLKPDIIIPAEAINEGVSYKVIEIGPSSFGSGIDYEEIWTIQLPEGLKTIRSSAFRNLENVSTLIIPGSVTLIEGDAFGYCEGLKSVKFLDGDETLEFGESVFYGAHFNNLYLGRNISYKTSPFIYQSDLTELSFGNPVTEIGSIFISNATALNTVTIPKQVTSVGNSAFSNCSVAKLVIEDSEENLIVGSLGFKNIEEIYLGRNIEEDNFYSSFYENTSIKKLTIGNLVNEIPEKAFYGCTGINEVIIADGHDTLQIGSNSFTLVKNIETAYLGRNISYSTTSSPFYRQSALTTVKISDFVTEIGESCFSFCSALTSVELSQSLTSIGKQAFYKCSSLMSLEIPSSVTAIETGAFNDCSGIKELNFVDGKEILQIKGVAFSGVNMEIVHLGRSIQSTNRLFQGKTSLKEVIIGDYITLIMNDEFRGCNNLTTVKFPSFLSSIGSRAFASCGFTQLSLSNVGSINSEAFRNCVYLENVTLDVNSIGDFAFDECKSLINLTLVDKDASTHFGELVFNGSSIENLYLGSNISYSTSTSPFANNKSLQLLTIGDKVSNINEKAFDGCTGINEINCKPLTPPAAFDNSFSYTTYKNADLIIPEEAYEAYKNDIVWRNFSIFDKPILIESIQLDPSTKEAEEGETFKITATVLPEDATDKTLEWSSSDESVAMVDETGLVSVLKEGECVI
ncbi:MAG: leucine-rich repeat protein, partial [Muribaculaceae bacterium]|nr:leucine-rich repeat protein [Muribaculaceae bacterium]